jgi:hypothetical protein
MTMEEVQAKYRDLKQPGAFSSRSGFLKSNKNLINDKELVEKALLGLRGYSLHVPVKKRFRRRRVYSPGIDNQWAIDLLDMRRWNRSNFGTNYILCVVDVFSKMAWMEAIKNKTAESVVAAMQNVVKRTNRKCVNLQSDEGLEFLNRKMKRFTLENEINHFVVYSPMKCCIAERFFRTIGQKISRYMTEYNTKRFIDKLHFFEFQYNHSYHRSIAMKPIEVNKENEMDVWHTLYGEKTKDKKPQKVTFKVGDAVLRSRKKSLFEKGYSKYFEETVYFIKSIKNTNPPMYVLCDDKGQVVKGAYYRGELLRKV